MERFSYRYGNTAGNCHQGTMPPWIPNHPTTQRIVPLLSLRESNRSLSI